MISEDDTETLALHAERIRLQTEKLTEFKAERDDFIRELLDKGGKPTELGRATGMTRERIYQIKERRR